MEIGDGDIVELPRVIPYRPGKRIEEPEREPRRTPMVPIRVPEKVPARRSLPDRHEHYLQEIPYECPICGKELQSMDDNSLVCPVHGVVFSIEPSLV
jgi:hypothetical protein